MSLSGHDQTARLSAVGDRARDAALLAGEPVQLLARLPVARLSSLQSAVALLGAQLELADVPRDGEPTPVGPWLLEAGAVLALGPDARRRLRALTATAPAFLFSAEGTADVGLSEAGALLTGSPMALLPGGAPARYDVARGLDALRPFDGLSLRESEPRVLPFLIDPDPRGAQPVISSDQGAALARIARADGGELWVSAVAPLAHVPSDGILRRRFHSGDFLELLPLLGFLRHCLGERAWRRPSGQAAFMIDDPNLRADRYGWVDYRRLRDAGRRHRFHTSIAMAPVDSGKTSRQTAALFRDSPELSLVMHGVYHTHHEFAQSVSPARARQDLGFGLAAMDAHGRRHDVACPPVMTFPFSKCSSEWLQAMRDVGMAAAVTGPNPYPFLAELSMLVDPAFNMLPAEMGHGGFAVMSRSFLAQSRDDLLFAAWLGKPLIIYLHHEDLSGGLDPLIETAEFVNERIDTRWTDLGAIAAANYQVRDTDAGRMVRLFSGRVQVAEDGCVAVLKPVADRHSDERVWVDGREVSVQRVRGRGVLAPLSGASATPTIVAGPALTPATGSRRLLGAGFAHGRRDLTELRDRLAPVTARILRNADRDQSTIPAFIG